jgi:hypothetical protein
MFLALLLLTAGCLLRVSSEILAYQGFFRPAWEGLPLSAVTEMIAVSLFAINLWSSGFISSGWNFHYFCLCV